MIEYNSSIFSTSTLENAILISVAFVLITPTPYLSKRANLNVSASTFIDVPSGCCVSAAIKNTSTIPVNVQNANLIVERVA